MKTLEEFFGEEKLERYIGEGFYDGIKADIATIRDILDSDQRKILDLVDSVGKTTLNAEIRKCFGVDTGFVDTDGDIWVSILPEDDPQWPSKKEKLQRMCRPTHRMCKSVELERFLMWFAQTETIQ